MEEVGTVSTSQADAPAPSNRRCPQDLREWLHLLELAGELKEIDVPVNLKEELSAITFMAAQNQDSQALLFNEFTEDGKGGRVLANMLAASQRRYSIAMGLDPELSLTDTIVETRKIIGSKVAPKHVPADKAPVNANILLGDDIDLTKLPAPQFWPHDGGRYLGTADITFTKDPETGRVNMGVYRQQLHGPRRVGMYTSPGKHGGLDREAWWARGEPCPVVAAYGIDPVTFMTAGQVFGSQESEIEIAGGLMGAPMELTDGVVVDLPIPANAEIVIEGYLYPGDLELEGPLGEFTGYYGNPQAPQPVIQVEALHLRDNPIVTTALMAQYPACEIGAYYGIMRSAAIWNSLETLGIPGIKSVYAHPAAASGWGLVAVSVEQAYAGHVAQTLALTAQVPAAAYYTKYIIAVDEDVDPTDINQILWAMTTRCDPATNIDFLRNTWSTKLDPSQGEPADRPYGSKALIDACKPHRHLDKFPRASQIRRATYEKVAERWNELGFEGTAPQLRALDDEAPE